MKNEYAICLGCGAPLSRTLVDLGLQPLANSYVRADQAGKPEPRYPLHARVCDECLLVQVDRVVPPDEIFSDYAYFSSFSDSWLAHVKAYVATTIERFGLNAGSQVIEIASNDGYLLQYVVASGIPCFGIEPAANVAATAVAKGVPTEVAFFGADTARRFASDGRSADLLICKNVMAHVPDINDFVEGIAILLKPEGVHTVEFPHLLNLIGKAQFDTIYHEHFSYLSLVAVETIFERHGLRVFDVEEVATHGGSLRVFACRSDASHVTSAGVEHVRAKEREAHLDRLDGYGGFDSKVRQIRQDLLAFLDKAQAEGRTIVAYGAAAKGNTLLNYCGINAERIKFVADRNPVKQNMLLPGSHIPVQSPEAILAARPDYVLILPWNIRTEVMEQLSEIRQWGGKFVTAIPKLTIES